MLGQEEVNKKKHTGFLFLFLLKASLVSNERGRSLITAKLEQFIAVNHLSFFKVLWLR